MALQLYCLHSALQFAVCTTAAGGGWIFIVLVPLIGALILLFFMIVDGTEGENRFGVRPE